MSKMDTLAVDLGNRSYNIHVGSAILADAARLISPVLSQKRVIIVSGLTQGRMAEAFSTECSSYSPILSVCLCFVPREAVL